MRDPRLASCAERLPASPTAAAVTPLKEVKGLLFMTQAMLNRWLGAVLALGLLALPLRAEQPKAEQAKSQDSVDGHVQVGKPLRKRLI